MREWMNEWDINDCVVFYSNIWVRVYRLYNYMCVYARVWHAHWQQLSVTTETPSSCQWQPKLKEAVSDNKNWQQLSVTTETQSSCPWQRKLTAAVSDNRTQSSCQQQPQLKAAVSQWQPKLKAAVSQWQPKLRAAASDNLNSEQLSVTTETQISCQWQPKLRAAVSDNGKLTAVVQTDFYNITIWLVKKSDTILQS